MEKKDCYLVGSIVEEDGFYICVPCGYKRYLEKGTRFPRCFRCMKGSGELIEGFELWERIE